MANFKTCNNGHNYDGSNHSACPYCPDSNKNADYDKTMKDFKKTVLFDEAGNNQFDKTMINEETMDLKTTLSDAGAATQHPFSRTTIVTKNDEIKTAPLVQSEKRKIVGWLVTFSNDEFGQDYKLYGGKNKIGSAANCDIVINDSSVSGDHTTVLFRENEFLIKDNFSTNGTKINGNTTDEGKLKDGDELKLGNTLFKFKTIF